MERRKDVMVVSDIAAHIRYLILYFIYLELVKILYEWETIGTLHNICYLCKFLCCAYCQTDPWCAFFEFCFFILMQRMWHLLLNRVGQAVGALLRRLRLPYQGNESYGKIRINGLAMKRWLQPKIDFPFNGKPELSSPQLRLGKGISHQQRNIRTGNLSLD